MSDKKKTKIYEWKYIVEKLNIPIEDNIRNNQYRKAEKYFEKWYMELNKNLKFSEDDVKYIINEIIDEAEHKINLITMDTNIADLKKEWPKMDEHVENLLNRGPYPYK